MISVQDKILDSQSHPRILPRSPEDYVRLLERVKREARRQKAHARAWELAKQQGVEPIHNIENLRGDFWPKEDDMDQFLSWLQDLRQGDKPRSIPE